LGFLSGNCYQAVVEDLFYNAQRPGRVGSRVKNPDPIPSGLNDGTHTHIKRHGRSQSRVPVVLVYTVLQSAICSGVPKVSFYGFFKFKKLRQEVTFSMIIGKVG